MTIDPGVYDVAAAPTGGDVTRMLKVLEDLAADRPHVRALALLEERWGDGWSVENPELVPGLPPDTTRGRWPHLCTARVRSDWACTRIAGHTGRHAAGDGEHVVAVWGDVWPPPRDAGHLLWDDGYPIRRTGPGS